MSSRIKQLPEESSQGEQQEDDDDYLKLIRFRSIRNEDALEEAISVSWEGLDTPLTLTTLLEPDELAPLFAGAQWAGTRVWHAAICAIRYLTDHYSYELFSKKNASLLELGCGLGVPGMILHALGAPNVYLTDQECIMSQLSKNVETNFPNSCSTKSIHALPLTWSREGVQQLLQQSSRAEKGFDIVLNCDCVYEPLYGTSWKLLVDVMEELLRINPSTIMLTSVERRTADGIDDFVQTLRYSPYVVDVELVFSDPEYKIEIYLAHGQQCKEVTTK